MKLFITIFLCGILALDMLAQDTTRVGTLKKNVVTVVDDHEKVNVKVGNENGIEIITDEWGDTTKIRIGRRSFNVIENNDGTVVKVDKEVKNKNWSGSFNAHWAGLEAGMNLFHQTDYSMYDGNEFFDLIPGKSLTWNLNFAEWAFKNEKNNFGLVTGLGFSFSDYTFDQAITIEKENGNGRIIPVPLDPNGLKKTKLTTTYLTAPLMLEVKTPLRMGSSRLYLAGGVIGGINIGAHTKYKYERDKEKYRSNFHLSPFKYELTGRIGFGDFCVFANYSLSPLFKDGKGPELYPLLIGISFPNI